MKTALYYFTGTGNSIALAEGLGKRMPDCKVQPVISNGEITIIDQDVEIIGIIFPVYIWSVPPIVEKFIMQNNFPQNAYVFSLCNYGGSSAYTLVYLKELLKQKNIELSAGFGLLMPGNYTPFYDAWSLSKQSSAFVRAFKDLDNIAEIVNCKKKTSLPTNYGPLGWFFTMLIYKKILIKKVASMDKSFYADNQCVGCKKCVKVCPVQNIVLKNMKPLWLHKCEQCFACLHICPTAALQSGKRTKNRSRYKFPGYKFNGHNS